MFASYVLVFLLFRLFGLSALRAPTEGTCKAEKQDEEVKFAAFSQWCENTARVKTNEISASAQQIELLGAKIQKHGARIRSLGSRAAELEEDVGRWKKDTKAAASVRALESSDYIATARDHQETLDALDGVEETN